LTQNFKSTMQATLFFLSKTNVFFFFTAENLRHFIIEKTNPASDLAVLSVCVYSVCVVCVVAAAGEPVMGIRVNQIRAPGPRALRARHNRRCAGPVQT